MPSAAEVAHKFFDAYRRQDVETMVDLCDDNANFRYVPMEALGRQRVVRGDHGKVRGIGKTVWTTLIDCFPDLTNNVNWTTSDKHGNVACEVVISGTQKKDYGSLAASGGHYDLPHLFILHVNKEGLIDDIAGYWDGADWYQQLGRVEID